MATLLFSGSLLVLTGVGYLIAWAIHDFRLGALRKQIKEIADQLSVLQEKENARGEK